MPTCKPGYIRRKAYSRRSRSRSRSNKRVKVRSTCIKDLGLPGHGPKLWDVKKGVLGKYGYRLKDLRHDRYKSLDKAVKSEGYATVVRQLNAVRNYTHRSQPINSGKYNRDLKYVQKTFGSRSRSRSRSRNKKRSRSRSRSRRSRRRTRTQRSKK